MLAASNLTSSNWGLQSLRTKNNPMQRLTLASKWERTEAAGSGRMYINKNYNKSYVSTPLKMLAFPNDRLSKYFRRWVVFPSLWPTPFPFSAASPLFPTSNVPHRFLQVAAGQLAVLGVVVENRAQLKMCPGLDPLRGLKLKHRLETVHT